MALKLIVLDATIRPISVSLVNAVVWGHLWRGPIDLYQGQGRLVGNTLRKPLTKGVRELG